MKIYLVVLLLFLFPASTAADGHATCTCLSSPKVENFTFTSAATSVGAGSAGYGVGCAAHDDGVLGPDCTNEDSEAAYCPSKWCYVDPAACAVEHSSSSFTKYVRFYSYATCGYMDFWKSSLATEELEGASVRVAVLGNTGGWMGSYCEDAAGLLGTESTCSGPIFDFVRDLEDYAGFTLEFIEDWPTEVYEACERLGVTMTKAFTPCAVATGLGYVDMCIGAMSVTAGRTQYTSFSSDMYHALFYVVTTKTSRNIVDLGLRIFAPFSGYTWLCVLSTILCCSLAIAYHEHPERHSDSDSDFQGLDSKLDALIKSTWIGLRAFISGGSEHQATTLPGRIVDLGFGMFLMLTLAAFTANLVSILLEGGNTAIGNMDDVISQNIKFCVQESKLDALLVNYPTVEPLTVVYSSRTAILEGIDSGACDAGLTSKEELEALQGQGDHCDKVVVGQPIINQPYSMAVSSSVEKAVGYWISNLKEQGVWQERLRQHSPGGENCAASADEVESASLKPIHLAGAFATAAIAIAISLVVAAYQQRPQRCRKTAENPPAVAADVAPSPGKEIADVNEALDLLAAKLDALRSSGREISDASSEQKDFPENEDQGFLEKPMSTWGELSTDRQAREQWRPAAATPREQRRLTAGTPTEQRQLAASTPTTTIKIMGSHFKVLPHIGNGDDL